MGDILIRDVPDDVVTAIDARAKRIGLSRTEYVRRKLTQDAESAHIAVTVEDLRRFADTVSDLGDDEVMREAWL